MYSFGYKFTQLFIFIKFLIDFRSCPKCTTTARQYGEVVLPDDSTGQGPGTLAEKLSRCKEGTAQFLPSWYNVFRRQARSRYKVG